MQFLEIVVDKKKKKKTLSIQLSIFVVSRRVHNVYFIVLYYFREKASRNKTKLIARICILDIQVLSSSYYPANPRLVPETSPVRYTHGAVKTFAFDLHFFFFFVDFSLSQSSYLIYLHIYPSTYVPYKRVWLESLAQQTVTGLGVVPNQTTRASQVPPRQ